MNLEETQKSQSVTLIHESCRQLHHKRVKQKQIFLQRTEGRVVKLFLLLLDFLDPLLMLFILWVILGLLPGQLQHGCLLKKAHLIKIYANHLSVQDGGETEDRL